MKRLNLLQTRTLLLLCMIVAGVSSVWADSYVKVTSASDLVVGEKYILLQGTHLATSTMSSSKYETTTTGYTTSDDMVTITTATPEVLTLGGTTGAYTLQRTDGKYLGYNSNTNFRVDQTTASANNEKWTIAYNSTYSLFTIANNQTTSRYIGYNSTGSKIGPYADMGTYSPATLYKKLTEFTLTATSLGNGTVSVVGNEITATPNEGYRVSKDDPYTITSGKDKVTKVAQSGNVFTITATGDCTIQINFEAIPSHTATFVVNGVSQNQTFAEGATIEFPAVATIGGHDNVGWMTGTISGTQDEAPATMVTSPTMGESDVTYYAVFAIGSSTTQWQKTTLSASLTEGTYAIISASGYAFNGTISSKGHGEGTTTTFSFTDGIATSAPDGTCELTLSVVTGGYKLYNAATNKYLYAKAAKSGNLDWQDTEDSYWYFGDSNLRYKANNAYLQSYDGDSYRTYANKTGTAIQLAKKTIVSTYSNYCTDILPTATISDAEWASWTATRPVKMPTGVTGYIVTKATTTGVTLAEVKAVTTGTPILLEGDADTYTMVAGTEADLTLNDVDLSDNKLLISDGTSAKGEDIFVLAKRNEKVGFYRWISPSSLSAGKVYLKIAGGSAREFIGFGDDETTGSESLTPALFEGEGAIYNLNGQQVKAAKKGLYIVNGKKVIIK